MAFDGTEGTFITLTEGASLTQEYRDNYLSGNANRKAIFLGREKLQTLLAQEGCEGLRFYFGAVEKGEGSNKWTELDLVVVGADANENDQLSADNKILDNGAPCPDYCSTANALNS